MGRRSKQKRSTTQVDEASAAPAPEASGRSYGGSRPARDNGSKFEGGFGETLLYSIDYWTLRARSRQLFQTNLYARGLIRRLVTNEINTGLHLECSPEEAILGFKDEALSDWSETVENRFRLWESDAELCDVRERSTFGALQEQIRMQALVEGDILVTLRQDQRTNLPRVFLVSGSAVRTPQKSPGANVRIEHGVELDGFDRHIAYWVTQRDGTSKRIPVWGEKSGRRLAWLVYGTDKLLDEVRGKPILSLVLQSLREIDRYRDSVQRKAVINSMLAMFIEKTQNLPSTRPITGGAVRKGVDAGTEQVAPQRAFRAAELIPGLVLEELQAGEVPKAFPSNGTDEKFGDFEAAIIQGIAWAYEIPPEILRLAFGSNYSASQAAINEFKMYLNRVRTRFGEDVCQPIYVEWLLSEVLAGRLKAEGLVESWRNTASYDVYGGWTSADWSGHIKPAVDMSKLVKGYREMVDEGFISRDRASRELTGTKYSKNVAKLKRENEQLAAARAVLAPPASDPAAPDAPDDQAGASDDVLEDPQGKVA